MALGSRPQYRVLIEKEVPMQTRDGVTLRADVYRPALLDASQHNHGASVAPLRPLSGLSRLPSTAGLRQSPPLQDTPPLAVRTGAWRDQFAPRRACVSNAGMAVVVGASHSGPQGEGRGKPRGLAA